MKRIFIFSVGCALLGVAGSSLAFLSLLAQVVIRVGGTALFADALAWSSLVVLGAMSFIHFKDPAAAVPIISVQLAPDAPLPAPSGWLVSSGAPGTGGQPTPPSTATATSITFSGLTPNATVAGSTTSAVSRCATQAASLITPVGPWGNATVHTSDETGKCDIDLFDMTTGHPFFALQAFTFTRTVVCPSGYASTSGGPCNLINATAVLKPADNTCIVRRVGNTLVADSSDADCALLPATVSVASGAVNVSASDGSSGAVTVDFSTGRTTVLRAAADGLGNTTLENLIFTAPGTGSSSGVAQLAEKGQATVPGVGSLSALSPGASAATAAAPPAVACGVPGKPACTARIDETGTPTDATLTPAKDAFDSASATRQSGISAVSAVNKVTSLGFGLSITWPTTTCTDPSIGILRFGLGSVPLCAHQAEIQSVGGWLIGILTAFTVFAMGIGAIKGGST
jgi:hypothetical protein